MLTLTPWILSQALGHQLIQGGQPVRGIFENSLQPLIIKRLLEPTLQRQTAGSISLGGALSLFLAAYRRAPRRIAEVGTYIGNSAASLACGAAVHQQPIHLITCDLEPCTPDPCAGLTLPEGSKVDVIQGSSTTMFEQLAAKNQTVDFLHVDGRLKPEDIKILKKLIKKDTLIALDDCEGDEKGHANLQLLRKAGLIQRHAFAEPFERELFRLWGMETQSTTGFLLPLATFVVPTNSIV